MALVQPTTLQRWGKYSLKDRMRLCRREFGYNISYYQMRQLYGLNRVRYVNTHWVHSRAVRDKKDLDELRREFAKTLGTIITDK